MVGAACRNYLTERRWCSKCQGARLAAVYASAAKMSRVHVAIRPLSEVEPRLLDRAFAPSSN
jgi:hypothetical protein